MTVVRLGSVDVPDFWQLRLRGFREEPTAFGSSYEEAAVRPLAEVTRDFPASGDDSFVLGARAPDGLAGLAGIVGLRREERRKRRHRAELWGMYVRCEARGQGVGRALLDELVRRARAMDPAQPLEQILLTVMAHNEPARALYRAVGFVVYGVAPRALRLDGKVYDEELMRLDL
jgi:ribosomal protein S18 acetylase RimI-like enzyme